MLIWVPIHIQSIHVHICKPCQGVKFSECTDSQTLTVLYMHAQGSNPTLWRWIHEAVGATSHIKGSGLSSISSSTVMNSTKPLVCYVAARPLVPSIKRINLLRLRIGYRTHTHTHTHTRTLTKYRHPHCACTPRAKYNTGSNPKS